MTSLVTNRERDAIELLCSKSEPGRLEGDNSCRSSGPESSNPWYRRL